MVVEENQAKVAKPKIPKPKGKAKKPFVKAKKRVSKNALLSSNCFLVLSQANFQSNPYFILSKPSRRSNQTGNNIF